MINEKIKYTSKILILSFILSYIFVGNCNTFATNYNYNITHDYIKSFGGNSLDCFNSIDSTKDYGFITVGYTSSTNINNIVNKGSEDAIIVKYDKDGNQQWYKSFGGNSYDSFDSVIQGSDEGFLVLGKTYSTNIDGIINKGGGDAIIVRYDKDGNQQWVKSFGGNGNDVFNSIIELEDSSLIVVGITISTNISGITNKGASDSFIAKYDKDGNQQWIKPFGGNNWDFFESVIQTSDSGFIVTGRTLSTNISGITNKGGYDAIIVKYDKDGNQQWVKSFGGNNDDSFYATTGCIDDGFIVVGDTYSTDISDIINKGDYDAIIVKYDKDGNQQWIKSFGGNNGDSFNSLTSTSDNGFMVVGKTSSNNLEDISNNGLTDALIIKYDKDGNRLYCKSFGGNSNDVYHSITRTCDNSFVAVGEFYSTNMENITNNGSKDSMVVKYIETKTIIPEETSANLNIEIVTDNSLELSISTNKISFEGYNGVEDLNNDKLSLTVSSGLYYDLYATLDSEIRGTNDTNAIIDKANLKIKTSDDLDYKSFNNIGEKVNLVANHKNGKDVLHNINLKLLKDSSVKADTYNTNITFEVIQK